MTTEEFEREFDILYNNIMSNAAPSIDAYEKSVFLTKAQENVVKALYMDSFEKTEQLTQSLKDLVKTKTYYSASSLPPAYPDHLLSPNSKIYEIPDDVLCIVYEGLRPYNSKDIIPVKPITHDTYNRIKNNPFKKERKNEALRVSSSINIFYKGSPAYNVVEIISTYNPYEYIIRYVKKPKPIVLYNEPGLTINGVDYVTQCELDSSLHSIILDTAVKLAVETYKQYS